jgi:hypothetical protein
MPPHSLLLSGALLLAAACLGATGCVLDASGAASNVVRPKEDGGPRRPQTAGSGSGTSSPERPDDASSAESDAGSDTDSSAALSNHDAASTVEEAGLESGSPPPGPGTTLLGDDAAAGDPACLLTGALCLDDKECCTGACSAGASFESHGARCL